MFNKKHTNKKTAKKKETFADQVKLFFSTYLLALVIRTFLIEASQIPSQSMVPSLKVGDILMVEKISLGTYIPVLNQKIPSILAPKVNDMVVFVSPEWKSPGFVDELVTFLSLSIINKDNTFQNPKILVKRIVGGPGDTLTMTNRQLYHNNIQVTDEPVATQNQVIYNGGKRQGRMNFTLFDEKTDEYSRIIQYMKDDFHLQVDSLEMFKRDEFEQLLRVLLVQGFPEITIPEKGVEIIIGEINNYEKYLLKMLIQRESGIRTDLLKGKILQNDTEILTWIPKDNYYFMMGDNRDFSEDGRYFGYVPQQRIYGRVLFRYWPLNRFSFRTTLQQKDLK